MLRPWVLAVVAAACAVVAVAIPRGPWVDEIHVVEQTVTPTIIEVEIDDQHVVLHAPEGYTIQGWGEDSEPSVQLTMMGDDGIVSVRIGPGREEGGLVRRGAVSREIVDGATMTVFSRLPNEIVQRLFDELEIS